MQYFIDTADQKEIDKWKDMICGVTSNPSLLQKSNITTKQFIDNNKENFSDIFIQVHSFEEVKKFQAIPTIIFKVPLLITNNFNGFKLLKKLIEAGYRTCATITYDLFQFDFACCNGSEYSIVLCAKNNNNFFLYDCMELKETNNYQTKVIAASFRSYEDIKEAVELRTDYATIPPVLMEGIFTNSDAVIDYNKFYGIE